MYNANSMKEKLVPYQNQSAQQKVYNTKNYACAAEVPMKWQQQKAVSLLLEHISTA